MSFFLYPISYSICIRPEEGYCCIQYSPCTDARSWSIHLNAAAPGTTATDANCAADYVGISGISMGILVDEIKRVKWHFVGVADSCRLSSGSVLSSKLCGAIFGLEDGSAIATPSACGKK